MKLPALTDHLPRYLSLSGVAWCANNPLTKALPYLECLRAQWTKLGLAELQPITKRPQLQLAGVSRGVVDWGSGRLVGQSEAVPQAVGNMSAAIPSPLHHRRVHVAVDKIWEWDCSAFQRGGMLESAGVGTTQYVLRSKLGVRRLAARCSAQPHH